MRGKQGVKIRELRENRAWTQQHLAEVAGIDVRTVQRLESGAQPSLESLAALAAAFNVDVSELREPDRSEDTLREQLSESSAEETGVKSPNFEWYSEISRRRGLQYPRCPFASTDLCPRYWMSLSLLGRAESATTIDPAEDTRLEAKWRHDSLGPKTMEQEPLVAGAAGDI